MYTIQSVCNIIRGNFLQFHDDAPIDHLAYDSRNISFATASLFFALHRDHQDGHAFLHAAYKKSVRNFVVDKEVNTNSFLNANIIRVDDTLKALQHLATHHRKKFSIPVIGITGSNGKTIVKEWLYQLLHEDLRIVRSPKSYNSQLGVPLSVWLLRPEHELAIIEAGISRPGEMKNLQEIIQPTIGLLTNIGDAHSANFKNREEKLKEKLKLFEDAEIIIGPDENLGLCKGKKFTWGKKSADLVISSREISKGSTRINGIYKGEEVWISIPFTDEASIQNAISCWCVLIFLGWSSDKVRQRFSKLHPVDMRLELKHSFNGCVYVNDSYSADMDSLKIALDFVEQQAAGSSKTIILSEFMESDKNENELYGEIADLLNAREFRKVIVIGERIHHVMSSRLSPGTSYNHYYSVNDLVKDFRTSNFFNEIILIKGARSFQLERIALLFDQKQHQTVLEIDLHALSHNLKEYQRLLKPGTRVMVMVKAFSYGSGGAEIASTLQYHNADFLGVAYADEGADLVRSGISLPIMVMNAEPSSFHSIIDHNLQPVLYSFELLSDFEKFLHEQGLEDWPVHIEIDTGMSRLGFALEDVERMAVHVAASRSLSLQSVFSHLAASEDPLQDEFTKKQSEKLMEAIGIIEKHVSYPFLKHISNSAAIVRHPHLQMDMVRLGIGIYGVEIDNEDLLDLHTVATLRTTVAQLRILKAGETVSYNRKGVVKRDSLIATVRIGYADGYSRVFGNGKGSMFIHGRLAPVIGSVCMDMTMIDVTDIPGVKEGDEVIVFGPELPIQELARWAGTIPYEIMTGVSQRVKRVYFHE